MSELSGTLTSLLSLIPPKWHKQEAIKRQADARTTLFPALTRSSSVQSQACETSSSTLFASRSLELISVIIIYILLGLFLPPSSLKSTGEKEKKEEERINLMPPIFKTSERERERERERPKNRPSTPPDISQANLLQTTLPFFVIPD